MIEVSYYLRLYLLPVLVIGGCILNMLSFAVMRRMRNSTTSNYMAMLGLVDSGVLIIGGVSLWIHTAYSNMSFPLLSQYTCKLVPFLLYTLSDLSVFIIVVMTAERFYAVWRPLQANKMAKKGKFRLSMISSLLVCAFINCHFLFTHSVKKAKLIKHLSGNQLAHMSTLNSDVNRTSGYFLMDSSGETTYDNREDFVVLDELESMGTDAFENFHSSSTEIEVGYEQICIDITWHTFYEKWWVYIDATIYSFLPSILLTIFNISIIRYLFKAADESLKLKEFQTRENRFINMSPCLPNTRRLYLKNGNRNYDHLTVESPPVRSSTYLTFDDTQLKAFSRQNTPLTITSDLPSPNGSVELSLNRLYDDPDDKPIHRSVFRASTNGSILFGKTKPSTTTLRTNASANVNNSKRLNTRITVMLIALNITFCIFSMPMVILQIIYYSFQQILETTSYYLYTTSLMTTTSTRPAMGNLTNVDWSRSSTSSSSSTSTVPPPTTTLRSTSISIVSDLPVDEDLLNKIDLIKSIAELLQYLNHSTNFFLYSFSGKTFRKETKLFLLHNLDMIRNFLRKKKIKLFLLKSSADNNHHHRHNHHYSSSTAQNTNIIVNHADLNANIIRHSNNNNSFKCHSAFPTNLKYGTQNRSIKYSFKTTFI